MLSKELVKLLNDQVNSEWYSAYMYLAIYTYYEDKNLNGLANWFNVQTQEERDHARLFMQYLMNNGEKAILQDVKAPLAEFDGFREPLVAALAHERVITDKINKMYEVAAEQKDFRTMQFLDWFIKEQGEEERNAEALVKRYDLFGNDAKGLYLFDSELATRVYAPPTLAL